jgi:hypothetical protein
MSHQQRGQEHAMTDPEGAAQDGSAAAARPPPRIWSPAMNRPSAGAYPLRPHAGGGDGLWAATSLAGNIVMSFHYASTAAFLLPRLHR